MIIFLVGFMGSGKTTIGRKLASKLNFRFIDLDEQFEWEEATSIAKYFQQHGEEKFRKRESEVLKTTNYPDNCIVSTGGGLPCFFDNMEWMKAHGKVVYIQHNPKTLAQRLEHGKEERPLLHGKTMDELVEFITEKLAEREKYYIQATIVADGLSLTTDYLKDIVLGC
ncbi:AAA family ATPase [Mucilaginibacter sp. RS28]|uniref:Shikimate kinase n=1 Tax=Mucilaginibacter straminoryzae TaxID=2932774 RepID=A0A9X1X6K0_9SPHI|nr:shikimate kinase [Mucilaginibacter straminoryzae]MCJ8211280.1 AAA family ATPase [Mucilaginibacter straminoryzae]